MELILDRKYKKTTYSIGKLYIDGAYFCDTLEDRDRGLAQNMPLSEIQKKKVSSQTAIPFGTYTINMNQVSPKYSLRTWYAQNCHGGRVPRLENVPGFIGILIHIGNTDKDSSGCILVGRNTIVGKVTDSTSTFLKLYNKLYEAFKKGDSITITIK